MTVSFRVGRYLVALLWSWSFPAFIGAAAGYSLSTWQVFEVVKSLNGTFNDSIESALRQCLPADLPSAEVEQ